MPKRERERERDGQTLAKTRVLLFGWQAEDVRGRENVDIF